MNELPALSLVDIIALLLVAVGGIQGYFRGLSGEIARLVGAIVAFVAGVWLREPVGEWIVANTRLQERAATSAAFITTVVLALLIMLLLRLLIKKLVKVVFAESFDKFMGVLAGLSRMSIIVFIIFLCMNMVPHDYLNRVFGDESAIGRVVLKYVPMVRSTLEENNIIKSANGDKTDGRSEPAEGEDDSTGK